jgi:chromosome segregation ATPase
MYIKNYEIKQLIDNYNIKLKEILKEFNGLKLEIDETMLKLHNLELKLVSDESQLEEYILATSKSLKIIGDNLNISIKDKLKNIELYQKQIKTIEDKNFKFSSENYELSVNLPKLDNLFKTLRTEIQRFNDNTDSLENEMDTISQCNITRFTPLIFLSHTQETNK